MRVTNNMRQEQVLRSLRSNAAALAKAQEQISSGRRIERASDDPVAAARLMRSARGLRGVEQYRRNVTGVRAQLDAEESVLDQVGDLLTRAKELATSQASDTASAKTRTATAAEVDRLIEQVVQLGNTKVGHEYLFGGHQTATPPFQADGSYLGDDGTRQAEIGAGYLVDTTHTGRQLFSASGAIGALTSLRDELRTGTTATIAGTITGLDTAFDRTQVHLAENGARARQLDVAGQNLDASESSLTVAQNADGGISLEETTTRMLAIQNTLQAAYLSTNRLLNLSLTEYMR